MTKKKLYIISVLLFVSAWMSFWLGRELKRCQEQNTILTAENAQLSQERDWLLDGYIWHRAAFLDIQYWSQNDPSILPAAIDVWDEFLSYYVEDMSPELKDAMHKRIPELGDQILEYSEAEK